MKVSLSRFLVFLGTVLILNSSVFAAAPKEVQNLIASEKEGKIHLEWDPGFSADDVITGYKLYYGLSSVQEEGDVYDDEIVLGVQTSYSFDSLEKGTLYFFSITALDSQENESETYSKEVQFSIPLDDIDEETDFPELVEEVIDPPEEVNNPIEAVTEVVLPPPTEEQVSSGEVEAAELFDTKAPVDATDLMVDSSKISEGKVLLFWKKSKNLDFDTQDQILFTKKGIAPWDSGVSIGKDLEIIELEVEPNQNYEIKIVTIDVSENESEGVSLVFSTKLTQSGVESLIPFLIGMLCLLFFVTWKQKHR